MAARSRRLLRLEAVLHAASARTSPAGRPLRCARSEGAGVLR